ncbi:chondroitinase family polysaccharide lyase [Bacteroides muris (ex Afrizal et al. 2022)]|uniref:Chondroitinase n=1 Tax=Bacteroides muris (ex Afrizal et al. 2022) TaxID=2516960 RepID=A0A4S2B7G3_9BACE|nr:chondroitinase family polysaccharide lyase [Bacteroides muris (ex Afrizal et al. 2022)]TGY09672.1 chondroitinase [Bacteroides muris (ex Afrizal et al. 2022)]
MTRKFFQLLFILTYLSSSAFAQFVSFEEEIPCNFKSSDKQELALSSSYYKEGSKSLEWKFSPNSILDIPSESVFTLEGDNGITLWIYNEKPQQDSLRFEFYSPNGHVSHHFGFRLYAAGWRACWISFKHMQGDKQDKKIAGYRIIAPNRTGRVFIDRLTFPVKKINDRTTPDLQMPTNNSLTYRDLWHWCRVWQWEQYQYDLPLSESLTTDEKQELATIEARLTAILDTPKAPKKGISKAYSTFKAANIRPSSNGFTGAPVVAPDELNRRKGELSWNNLEDMLSGFAYDAYYNHSAQSAKNYFLVWDYAINQGFAFGSGMGTNHHYGYQVRKIYTTAWLMRDAIWKAPNRDNILSALIFWSALQETRIPFQYGRDELLDSWHTLLMAKTVSALLFVDERERARALAGLSRWLSGSLQYSPGTIGGIKVDGTTFHHGGFYPAYTTGVLAIVGQFIALTSHTRYVPTMEARQVLKSAFISMRNYCNIYEWGIGISGRHPFGGSMKENDVAAFAYLALAGDLSGESNTFDHHLAADYMRLCNNDTPEAIYFRKEGITPAKAPQGFFVYNYGSAGIFRRNDWMVTLKGYTTDVWGSEIYRKDNRYGRYQSYGSVQIMGYPSRKASGFDENGWDWNRLPGTTTIHLPFDLLDSPLPGTTMAHSKENFSGSSSLEGKNGMFAMKLMERNLKNFTPDFVARKSVFCFNNRMICLGTGISNSNASFPTETTLFQSTFQKGKSDIYVDGKLKDVPFHQELNDGKRHCIQDGYNNYYLVNGDNVQIQIARQDSHHEKNRAKTQGTFASAYINHGAAPQNAGYEYMVLIQPSPKELDAARRKAPYQILHKDSIAHVVIDKQTGITAYAAFETYLPQKDELFLSIPAETMVMQKQSGSNLLLSVCDPNLNISEKAFTTKEPSRPIEKKLILKGQWKCKTLQEDVTVEVGQTETVLTVTCRHGQPIEFILLNK